MLHCGVQRTVACVRRLPFREEALRLAAEPSVLEFVLSVGDGERLVPETKDDDSDT